MAWGLWRPEDSQGARDFYVVAPEDGEFILPPHQLNSKTCVCNPRFETRVDGKLCVIHEQVN